MLMKRPNIRQFNYSPRYYDPVKDPDERKKRKLNFSRGRKFIVKRSNIFRNILILLVIVLIYLRVMKII